MSGHFIINKKQCAVKYSDGVLQIERINADTVKHGDKKTNILLHDILSVKYDTESPRCLSLYHVVPRENKTMRSEVIDCHGDEESCKILAEQIEDALSALTRPRRLLVFVNPKSGHKKGVKIYSSKVAPLLKLCGIHIECIVTERAGQTKELLATYDLRLIHGIVSVGGDGMFSECVNGLLARLQSDAHIDVNDPDVDIASSKIPIGIVPAGSGNYLVNYIHGTRDVETAVLKVILGDHHMSNVVSVHQGRELTCYASLLVEFGLIGNMMHDCEKFRWLGPSRYSVVPIATLAKRKPVDVEIEYLPEENAKSSPRNSLKKYSRQVSLPANNPRWRHLYQRNNSSPHDTEVEKKQGWEKVKGRVYGVDTYVVTQKDKAGDLVPRFGDSALTMWMTDKCSMSEHVQQLTKLQKAQAGYLDYDFIRKVRTTRYHVKLSSADINIDENGNRQVLDKFYLNADGEAIKLATPEFEVKLHQSAMPIYGKVDS